MGRDGKCVPNAFRQLAAQYSGSQEQDYIWFNGQVAALENSDPAAPCATCYFSVDPLGSIRMITDENADIVSRHDFMPFGDEIPAGYAERDSSLGYGASDSVSQRFTGQYRDTETGVDYFNARYFGSALGRFTSPDPMNAGADASDPQTWNGYAYVRNNPLNATDPSGMIVQGPGEPGDPFNPCWDPYDVENTQLCWGVPPGWGSGGGGTQSGGGGGSSSPTPPNSSAPPESIPPGSFPGGENLGLPPWLAVPGPWGVDTGCDFGPCGILPGGLTPQQTAQLNAALVALAGDFWRGIQIWVNGRGAPGDPYETRLFGTHWCGPGGAGPTVNVLDQACQAHDLCYDASALGALSNYNLGLSAIKKTALQSCNQSLCDATRSVFAKNNVGSSRVNWYFSRVPVGSCHP